MIGLPTETPEDRAAIPDLVRRVRERTLAGRREKTDLVRISVTLGGFVPKAWTPFQWHPFAGVRALKEAQSALIRGLRKIPNVAVTHDVPKWSYVQALLSLGDRRVADILEAAVARERLAARRCARRRSTRISSCCARRAATSCCPGTSSRPG